MKKLHFLATLFLCFTLAATAQETETLFTTTTGQDAPAPAGWQFASNTTINAVGLTKEALLSATQPQKNVLLYTAQNQPVEYWYFPGTSRKNALVIGGMHGSELSAVEVAKHLVQQLLQGQKPYYNVLVIPVLFPDNARAAMTCTKDRLQDNTGRYTTESAADPNRQMPAAGQPFLLQQPVDAVQREIENEMKALLHVIQLVKPERLLSIHAIRDQGRAGVFADPRTTCEGTALGFDSDEDLALLMAEHIQAFGGTCRGNNLDQAPTALYYLDPAIAPAGQKQMRSYQSPLLQGKSRGVSLGTWSSTAVCHNDGSLSRPAIRTFTVEFPGYLAPAEYKTRKEQQRYQRMVTVYADAIRQYFLQAFAVEGPVFAPEPFASN